MAKFMILYNASVSARALMADTTPEQMKASMDEWIAWREEASKTAKVDFGLPLQAVAHVTPDSVGDSDSDVSGYAIIEADSKDAVVELLKNHPHLQRADTSIDVLEMLSMPGL